MRRTALITSALITVALAGCASTGSTTDAAGAPSSGPSAAAAASSAPAPSPSSQTCTTHACIVQDLDQGLVGAIDQGDAAATKVKCIASTVKNEGGGNYDARCTVHYSDHTYAAGYGTVDMSQGKVLFSPDD